MKIAVQGGMRRRGTMRTRSSCTHDVLRSWCQRIPGGVEKADAEGSRAREEKVGAWVSLYRKGLTNEAGGNRAHGHSREMPRLHWSIHHYVDLYRSSPVTSFKYKLTAFLGRGIERRHLSIADQYDDLHTLPHTAAVRLRTASGFCSPACNCWRCNWLFNKT